MTPDELRQRVATSLAHLYRDAAAKAVHIGWVSEGESFGEVAIVNPLKPRPVTCYCW